MADSQQAIVFRSKVRAGDLVAVRKMLQAGVDFTLPGTTLREWTPLHTAAWGTAKPQNDREIVEALLTAAHKSGKGKEEALRSAKDAKDGSAQHAEDALLVSARAHRSCASCAWHGWLWVALCTLEKQPCRSEGESAARTPASADVADAEAFNHQARHRWTLRRSVATRWGVVVERRLRRAKKSKRRVACVGPGRTLVLAWRHPAACACSSGPSSAERLLPGLYNEPCISALLHLFSPAQAKARQDCRVA